MSNIQRVILVFSRLATAMVIMVVLALSIVAARQNDAFAENQSPFDRRTLEGTWQVEITLRNCLTGEPVQNPFPALASFARGGTVTTADGGLNPAVRGTGLGTWWRAREGEFSAVTEAFLFSASTGARTGAQRIAQDIEVAVDGETFAADVTSEIQNIAGNVIATGCATSVGWRQ